MVLVGLQTELSNGDMNEAVFIGLQAIPLHQQVEYGHSEGQAHGEVFPHPMHYLLEMTHQSEHGEHRLYPHTLVPLTTLAELEVGRVSVFGMKSQVSQDNHLVFKLGDKVLEASVVDIGGVTVPSCNQSQVIEHQTQLASHYPSVIGLALLAYLTRASAFAYRVNQLDAIAIDDPQHCGRGQEGLGPGLMGSQATEETSTMGQLGEHGQVVLGKPAIKGPGTHSLDGVEQAYGDNLARPQRSLGVILHIAHLVIHSAEQLGDKILSGHAFLLSLLVFQLQLGRNA